MSSFPKQLVFSLVLTVLLVVCSFVSVIEPKEALLFGFVMLLWGYFLLLYAVWFGVQSRSLRLAKHDDEDVEVLHRQIITLVGVVILAGVIGIAVGVRRDGGSAWDAPMLKTIHFSFVAGMLYTFLRAVTTHTGIKKREHHKRYTYSFVFFYTAALFTGSMLLERRLGF